MTRAAVLVARAALVVARAALVVARAALVAAALSAPGLALASGGYEHNHANVRWNTLETEHFHIHWPESTLPVTDPGWFTTRFTAGQLARIAEESYPKITGQLDHELTEKVHVVVYDQDEGWEGNGFAIAEYDWTGFAANWGPIFRMRGRMEFLSDVFVHEFAHIVSLKAFLPWAESATAFEIGGLSEDEEWLRRWGVKKGPRVNADIGVSAVVSAHAPFWWAEGGAEYWSHQAGYNYWGTSRDAFLRVSVLEGRVLSADEWTTRMDKVGFEGERGYNHGYAFGLWLAQRFPERDVFTDMARISGERWRWSWDRVVQEATGVPMAQLYAEWRAHLDDYYGAQIAEIGARGVVEGREMSLVEPPYERNDDDWKALPWRHKKEALDGVNAYQELPWISPDGQLMSWFDQGFVLRRIGAADWGAVGGAYVDEGDHEALRAWDRRTFVDGYVNYLRPDFAPDSRRVVVTSWEDRPPQALRDAGLTVDLDGRNWGELAVGTIDTDGGWLDVTWAPVPNTLRAVEAAFHPDGRTLAFSRYGDGTHELWTVGVDGSDPTRLTDFGDGTQINGIDWSDDGERLLVGVYRNFQQDLWLLDVGTRAWTRLTDSEADELDPLFGPDGRVWFASDLGGVFDVFALDPDTGEVRRQTQVIGGAYGPTVSPEGHLFYTAFTGHGYRILGVNAADLKDEVVDYPGACAAGSCDASEMDFRPEPVDVEAQSRRYNPLRASMPLAFWPVVRASDKNAEIGTSFFIGDYVEQHYLDGQVTFGKDRSFTLSYYNETLWPSLNFGVSRYDYKGAYSYASDLDGLAATTGDRAIVDVKFEQRSDDAWAAASYAASDSLWLGAGVDVSRYSFRDTGDGLRWQPFMLSSGVGVYAEWSLGGWDDDGWANLRRGRKITIDYGLRHSAVVDPEVAGMVYDDGEQMDRYWFQRVQLGWSEYIPVPFTKRHTLQLDLDAGFIDRNVMGWDEFIAGGRHPYHWGSGTIGNNTQFSGYEGWSLSGETMLIANASYRLPLARDLNLKTGPIYTEAVYLQLLGSVGNLWSHRVEGPSHVEGYAVVPSEGGKVVREIPFRDYASKNSTPDELHYLLADVGAEVRLNSYIWNDFEWDSFVRVSYGFQETAGYGDVDSDLVQTSIARDAASELSSETEPPTFRVYLGLGTGW